uniref:Uncharacterized protein n=1 Tax=Zea mays TaxID=4577 RepID=A0A804NK98_MAIZE
MGELLRPTILEEEIQVSQTPTFEDKTINELVEIDPDIFHEGRWWFPSCTKCNKSSIQTSTKYRCIRVIGQKLNLDNCFAYLQRPSLLLKRKRFYVHITKPMKLL